VTDTSFEAHNMDTPRLSVVLASGNDGPIVGISLQGIGA
jgi:hypothetical protein